MSQLPKKKAYHFDLTAKMRTTLKWIKTNPFIFMLFITAYLVIGATTFFNGTKVCVDNNCGLYIGGLHFHDALWHLALANTAFNTFPFQLPIFAGAPLQGYNYFLDLIIFLLTKIGIPAIVSYFKLIPAVVLIGFSILAFRYAKNINKSGIFIACILFFLFFGSSFSYLLSYYHTGSLASYFYAQAMQSGRMLLNLQYAVSLLPFFAVLIILQKGKRNIKDIVLIGLLILFTAALKVYGGIVLVFLVMTDFLLTFVKDRNMKDWILYSTVVGIFFLLSILIFYNPFQSVKTGSIFAFAPFALSRTMIEAQDMFYMPRMVLARYYLQSVNPHSPRLLAIELVSIALFLFYNFGTRVVGLVYLVVRGVRKTIRKDELVLFLTVIFSSCLTLLLVQKGDWWNVIQFFGYTLLLMNYFAGMFLYTLFRTKKPLLIGLGIVIILLTLPTNIEQIRFAFEKQVSISEAKLEVLTKLHELPDGTVLTLPPQDTSYVSAFSGKPLYVADKGVLNIIGINARERMVEVNNINPTALPPMVRYVYIDKKEMSYPIPLFVGFRKMAETSESILFMRIK